MLSVIEVPHSDPLLGPKASDFTIHHIECTVREGGFDHIRVSFQGVTMAQASNMAEEFTALFTLLLTQLILTCVKTTRHLTRVTGE